MFQNNVALRAVSKGKNARKDLSMAQLLNIVKRISNTLAHAGLTWANVARASFFLHRSQRLEDLRALFAELVKVRIPSTGYTFVDTRQGKLVEIETTAAR